MSVSKITLVHLFVFLCLVRIAQAGAQALPVVGSPQPATAAPSLPRPVTRPIVVPLFTNDTFANFNAHTFRFTPPANRGPWSKVIFVADFHCTTGRQFDRSADIFLGNVNIYYGSTQEPSGTVSPSWHVERDMTDYGGLFTKAQKGTVVLGNVVNSIYTGVYTASASLLFYPAGRGAPPAQAANLVLPMNNTPGPATLPDAKTPLAATFTFPTNIVQAYLDVIMQGQIGDEFWYLGAPDRLKESVGESGGTGFREGEISIDGMPAGVAPVYPWIFTGGIDPLWWRPIPGVQTYNFAPFRVNLTPFAGRLDNGQPHTVSVRVYNNANYFNVCATLLLYTDPHKKRVTGAVTANTIKPPNPVVKSEVVTGKDGAVSGPISVTSRRNFTVAGYVDTSEGRVYTRVDENIVFSNRQNYDISRSRQATDLVQDEALLVCTTKENGGLSWSEGKRYDWPLTLILRSPARPRSSSIYSASVIQAYNVGQIDCLNGIPIFASRLTDRVSPSDTIVFPASGGKTTPHPVSIQTYSYDDTLGDSWSRTVTASNLSLTSVSDGKNRLPNNVLPDDFGVPVN